MLEKMTDYEARHEMSQLLVNEDFSGGYATLQSALATMPKKDLAKFMATVQAKPDLRSKLDVMLTGKGRAKAQAQQELLDALLKLL